MSFFRDMLWGRSGGKNSRLQWGIVTSLDRYDVLCMVYDFVHLAVWIVRCHCVVKKQVLYSRMIVVILQLQLAIWTPRLHI